MKRSLSLAAAAVGLLSAGCTSTRYVSVPCLNPEQYQSLRDAEPPKVGEKLTGRADEDIRPIAGSAIRLRAYSQGLLGVLEGCQGT